MATTSFNAEFLERRMEQHRRLLHDYEREAIAEIIDEIQTLPKRRPRNGQLFERLENCEIGVA